MEQQGRQDQARRDRLGGGRVGQAGAGGAAAGYKRSGRGGGRMKVAVSRLEGGPAGVKAPAVCVFVHPKGGGGGGGVADGLGPTGSDGVDRAVAEELAGGRGRGRLGRAAVIDSMGLVQARRIILAWTGGGSGSSGGGDNADASPPEAVGGAVRHAVGAAAVAARDAGCQSLSVVAPQSGPWEGEDGAQDAVRQIVEGAKLSMYRFDRYRAAASRKGPGSLAILVGGAGRRRPVPRKARRKYGRGGRGRGHSCKGPGQPAAQRVPAGAACPRGALAVLGKPCPAVQGRLRLRPAEGRVRRPARCRGRERKRAVPDRRRVQGWRGGRQGGRCAAPRPWSERP